MTSSIIILSDIHGNLSALDAVINDFESKKCYPDSIAILGDNINYGMRPNEVVERLMNLSGKYNIIVNIFGNHEKALIDGDTTNFSTDRGKQVLNYTRNSLTDGALEYIKRLTKEGKVELKIDEKKFLFIHGSLTDPYWGKLNPDMTEDPQYSQFDYVISGHSHIPQLFEKFYPIDDPEYRNKKRTVFLNPGSVGQPRNHNPRAQYLYIDIKSEIFHFNSVIYNIENEQRLFKETIDPFYKNRLKNGI